MNAITRRHEPTRQFRAQHLPRPRLRINRCGRTPGLEKSPARSDDELVIEEIRQVIEDHGHLPVDVAGLSAHANLYEAGLSSAASVDVMLALENHFDIEFPDRMLTRSVFASLSSIETALSELRSEATLS